MSALPSKTFDAAARGPLHGLRIIDMSRLVAGNMLTLQLADFGADVIKVEPPEGDSLRHFTTEGMEIWWKTYSRNKRSVGLDLRRPESIGLVKQLVAGADVLVESFRPGVLEAMGLAPEVLHAINPRLVITRISGWGQTGPYRHKPGFGTLVEGYSGFAAINGFADREPVLPPIFLGDMTTGLYGASATMTALWNVKVQGGAGQVVDLSLFEPTLSILGPQVANHHFTGKLKSRTGSRSSTTAPRNAYRTLDDEWVCLSTASHSMARRLFESIGHGALLDDPRFATNAARLKNIEEVDRLVGAFVQDRTLAENLAFFDRAGVTIGPIQDARHLGTDAYVIERESIVQLPDAELGSLPMHNITPRLQATPGAFRMPAPTLGQHNRELLSPLLPHSEFQRLVDEGAISTGRRAPATA
ncbi:CoA transferase [Xylophilus rhododendri]|uniref:CoA transferase n=1 Tax=Xylophilus rhododendri TaxID=2697032 RepID=A0A857J8Y9_9BURK|nr:CoA transferase [Xylophilus rhododendri]QHJ00511.1 CoA transferase [Xylophilus rhododendri]